MKGSNLPSLYNWFLQMPSVRIKLSNHISTFKFLRLLLVTNVICEWFPWLGQNISHKICLALQCTEWLCTVQHFLIKVSLFSKLTKMSIQEIFDVYYYNHYCYYTFIHCWQKKKVSHNLEKISLLKSAEKGKVTFV